MNCPSCRTACLTQYAAQQGTLVDTCPTCRGLWLDAGEVLEFSDKPRELEEALAAGLTGETKAGRDCPRCGVGMRHGRLAALGVAADRCPDCAGLWLTAEAVRRTGDAGSGLDLAKRVAPPEDAVGRPGADPRDRLREIAQGLRQLPNLALRSAVTLLLLYGLVALVLITLVELGKVTPTVALVVAGAIAVVQFTLSPWLTDLSLRWFFKARWQSPEELPDHLRAFVERVCAEHGMRFPHMGLIDDGAPTAFTYGHHPSNARVVVSRGLLELLDPEEVEAVVAHELGHARNWDMALMTVANLAPMLLYFFYRSATHRLRNNGYALPVIVGSYVLYVVSEYIVLWFSRSREYNADRFAGRVTNNPNALTRALIKIGYGLAAQPGVERAEKDDSDEEKQRKEEQKQRAERLGALGPLNVFDRTAAVGMVAASAGTSGGELSAAARERAKGAMQWDLWNPWAKFYELHSTHPLVAKRLQALAEQAAAQGQEPELLFDRRQPESYWGHFGKDLLVAALPTVLMLLGVVAVVVAGLKTGTVPWWGLGVALAAAGVASVVKTRFVYRRDFFPHLSVAALLHKVKVSDVRPVQVTLTGTIIGKGVPGLIWSEDFVLRDRTGIIFLDYSQPLWILNFLFGLLRAGRYAGKQVRVRGWYRRAPVPYLEIDRLEVVDGSETSRRCYTSYARLALGGLMVVAGVVLAVLA